MPIPGPRVGKVSICWPDNPDKNRYLKKCHRIRHNKALYRNFQAVFQNVGGSRSGLGK